MQISNVVVPENQKARKQNNYQSKVKNYNMKYYTTTTSSASTGIVFFLSVLSASHQTKNLFAAADDLDRMYDEGFGQFTTCADNTFIKGLRESGRNPDCSDGSQHPSRQYVCGSRLPVESIPRIIVPKVLIWHQQRMWRMISMTGNATTAMECQDGYAMIGVCGSG